MKSILMPLSVAVFSASVLAYEPLTFYGEVGIPIKLSSTMSYVPEGDYPYLYWNFGEGIENKSVVHVGRLHSSVSYIYESEGIYNVVLEVKTEDQRISMTHAVMIIGNPTNQPPLIEPIAPIKATLGSPVNFDAIVSDSDGSIAHYIWQIDDFKYEDYEAESWNNLLFEYTYDYYGIDGWVDQANYYEHYPRFEKQFTYTYQHPGKHTAKLTVIDNQGQASIIFIPVEITEDLESIARISAP